MCGVMEAIMGIGMVASAAGSLQQGRAQASGMRMQAYQSMKQQQAYDTQAHREMQSAEYEVEGIQRNAERVSGAQANAYLSTGLALEGAPAEVMKDAAREHALDIAAIRWSAAIRSQNLLNGGDNAGFNAMSSLVGASHAKTASYYNAATSITSGFTSMYKNSPRLQKALG